MLNMYFHVRKMVLKKKKKKASLRVVVGIVCERHPCASAVLGLFPVTKADGVQASENCTCPISISKCRVCVCVPSDAFYVRMSKMADGSVLKKSFMNKNNHVMSFFFWRGGEMTQIHQLIV